METTKYICDNCQEEVNNGFILFRDVLIRQSNGKKHSQSIGVRNLDKELSGKVVCSMNCLYELLDKISHPADRGDYFYPGEQVGTPSPQGLLGK